MKGMKKSPIAGKATGGGVKKFGKAMSGSKGQSPMRHVMGKMKK